MDDYELLDSEFDDRKRLELLSTNNFVILFFLTMGLYGAWWMYKTWRFFKERENLDIMPAMRAIFAIFFLYSLMEKIQIFAKTLGYSKTYSSSGLYIAFILLNFTGQLPDPMWVISTVAFLCLIPPFNALNYAMKHSDEYYAREAEGFNQRQIILVFCGVVLWGTVIIELVTRI